MNVTQYISKGGFFMKYGKIAFMALAATLLVPAPKAQACSGSFGSFMSGFSTMPFMLGAGVATAGLMGANMLFGGSFGKLFDGLGKKQKKKKQGFFVAPCSFMYHGNFKPSKTKKKKFPSCYSFEKTSMYTYSGF